MEREYLEIVDVPQEEIDKVVDEFKASLDRCFDDIKHGRGTPLEEAFEQIYIENRKMFAQSC